MIPTTVVPANAGTQQPDESPIVIPAIAGTQQSDE